MANKDTLSLVDRAERMQRRRTRIMTAQGLLFVIWQTSYLVGRPDPTEPLRRVEQVQLAAYVFWAAALLVLLSTGGGWFRDRAARELANDEVTRDHRRSAFVWGYWALLVSCLGLYVASLFAPIGLMDTVHGLLSLGVALPTLRFVYLERRSERG